MKLKLNYIISTLTIAITCSPTYASLIVKCTSDSGDITYTNIESNSKIAKNCTRLDLPTFNNNNNNNNTNTINTNSNSNNKTIVNNNFIKDQNEKDLMRKNILELELAKEKDLLLKEQDEFSKTGSLEDAQKLKASIQIREMNINALNRELKKPAALELVKDPSSNDDRIKKEINNDTKKKAKPDAINLDNFLSPVINTKTLK